MIRRALAAVLAAAASFTFGPPAAAYPVDCAILLCLAGGFPPSEPCLRAKVVMMQRIMSFPFQPPLQIWNCPLRVSVGASRQEPVVSEIGMRGNGDWAGNSGQLITPIAGSDLDISGPEFAFLRSLRVTRIQYRQQAGKESTCTRDARVAVGRYDNQAEFAWEVGRTSDIPKASAFRPASGCAPYAYRSIMIDWQDVEGGYGFEEVRY